MTITIKPITAAVAIALVGILAGLALGQITEANSAKGDASASAAMTSRQAGQSLKEARRQNRTLSRVDEKLADIQGQLGASSTRPIRFVLDQIDSTTKDVKANTYAPCREITGALCHR